MSRRTDRAAYGPSWAEVILGAILSLVLGVALGAVLLVLRPVVVAKEVPKEPVPNAVYYIEGSRDASKARMAPAKRESFLQGQSVTVTEEEINALIAVASAPKAPGKAKEAGEPAAEKSGFITPGTPNVRIREGVLQVGVPVTIDLLGQKVIAQARGSTFEQEGGVFVFKPSELYLGSCPVQRLPFLAGIVREQFVASQPIPEDLRNAWSKLANVTIEGNAVKLTMP